MDGGMDRWIDGWRNGGREGLVSHQVSARMGSGGMDGSVTRR